MCYSSEPFVADADDAELANYAEFHAMKLALRNNDGPVGANDDSPLQGIATLNVRNVPAGVYVLRVTDTNGKEYHRKVVVD